jgi:dTDP-4-amino-4,6-dideoxygalactose transaminase
LRRPQVAPDRTSVFHLYVLQTAERDALLAYLQEQGIAAGIHYPIPLHLQPAFRHLGYKAGDFPMSEDLGRECLSLPLFPELTEDEVRTVAQAVRTFFKR